MTNFRLIKGGRTTKTPDKPEFTVKGLVAVQCVWVNSEGLQQRFRTIPVLESDKGDISFDDANWISKEGVIQFQSAILAPTKHDYSVDFIHVGVTAEQSAARFHLKRIHPDVAPRVWFGFSIKDEGTSHFDMQTFMTRAVQCQMPVASLERIGEHIHVLIGPPTSKEPQREPLWLFTDHALGAMALALQTLKGSILTLGRILIAFEDTDDNIFYLEELRDGLAAAGIDKDDNRYELLYSLVSPYPGVSAVQAICSLDIFRNLPTLLKTLMPPEEEDDEDSEDTSDEGDPYVDYETEKPTLRLVGSEEEEEDGDE